VFSGLRGQYSKQIAAIEADSVAEALQLDIDQNALFYDTT